ncbi:MAG: S8 family serine peptidase [Cytophagaceae bacterium]
MFQNIIIIIFLLLGYTTVFAQSSKKDDDKNNIPGSKHEIQGNYLPGTIIIKLKPQFRNLISKNRVHLPALSNTFKDIQVESIEPMFPGVSAPQNQKNKHGEELVDLSLIYVIKFTSSISVPDAIDRIVNSPAIEYAEPFPLDEILIHTDIEPDRYIPNDPMAQPGGPQYYLERMKAYEAWEVTKGDTNVVIAIVDTGINFDHEDLQNQVAINHGETGLDAFGNDKRTNGIDDDGDGYIDNWRGWDLGNNDNNPTFVGNHHGVMVTSSASSTVDNGIGLAGTGFNCRYMPIKASADNLSAISFGYQGIIYAAQRGAKVINLSWGGASAYNQAAQDIINFAAINHDAVVVAAAGNVNSESNYFPASYENVISVASSDTITSATTGKVIDKKWNHATFSYRVDVCAQGNYIAAATGAGGYTTTSGSSFSAPLVAGAAALVRSQFPEMTSQQVKQQLRVSGEIIDTLPENIQFRGKIGRLLNMHRAVTDNTIPGIHMKTADLKSKYGQYAFSGDTLTMPAEFINFLHPTSNLQIRLSCLSSSVVMIDSVFNQGVANTFQTFNNHSEPFKFYINPDNQNNHNITFLLEYFDGEYYDYQYFRRNINPTHVDIDTNRVKLTVTSNGRLAFNNPMTQQGSGFTYDNNYLIFSSGLMIGNRKGVTTKVSDCVRTAGSALSNDFTAYAQVRFDPSSHGDLGTGVRLHDTATASTGKIGVQVTQKTYAWDTDSLDNMIFVEYKVKNISSEAMDSLHVGLFTDWDIMDYMRNRADWDKDEKLGYVYSSDANSLYGGTTILTPNPPACYSLDHSNAGGNNINPNKAAGFSKTEKFTTISSGVARMKAGQTGPGNDVSQIIGATVYNLAPGEEQTVAFALLGADNFYDLKVSAKKARAKFKSIKTGSIPVAQHHDFCKGDTVEITIDPENGSKFRFYSSFPGTPVHTGSSYTNSFFESDTIYITNVDSIFESQPFAVYIQRKEIIAQHSPLPDTINFLTTPHVNLTSLTATAEVIEWKTGDGISYSEASAEHTYELPGSYLIQLITENEFGCKDTAEHILRIISPGPLPVVSDLNFCEGEPVEITVSPEQGTLFNFYADFPETLLHTGSSYTSMFEETSGIFVTNADSIYESEPVEIQITKRSISASFEVSQEPINFYATTHLHIIPESTGADEFLWATGDGSIQSEEVLYYTYQEPGQYTVSLTVENEYGCSDTHEEAVTIVQPGGIPQLEHIFFCHGDVVDITLSPENGTLFNFYNEYPGAPVFSGTSYNLEEVSSNRTLYITNADSLIESSPIEHHIIFHNDVSANFLLVPEMIDLAFDNKLYLVNQSSNEEEIEWFLNNVNIGSNSLMSYTFTEPGEYIITLAAKDVNGCLSTISKTFTATFTTSNIHPESSIVEFYPNPTENFLTVIHKFNSSKISYTIKDMMGRTVLQMDSPSDTETLDLSNAASGVYFLQILVDEKVEIRKFIKR